MNHVSVSPTDGNGPTQGQRKTLTRVGIEPCSSVGRAAEIWPEGRGFNSHPGQSFSLSLCGPFSISRANAHMVHMGLKSSTSHYTLFS